jgi:hypothetical protein
MQVLGLSILDYLLIFIVFLGGVVGLIRGILPQVISLTSLWFSLLATLWTYRLFSDNILQGLGISEIVSDTLSFLLILFISFQAIRLLIKSLTTPPEEKKKKPRRKGKVGPAVEHFAKSPTQKYIIGPLGAIAAIVLGFILTTVWTAVFLGVLQFIFQVDVSQAASDVSGVTVPGSGFAVQLKSSTLIHYFNLVLLWLVRSVSFFVIDSGPNILEVVINKIFPPG